MYLYYQIENPEPRRNPASSSNICPRIKDAHALPVSRPIEYQREVTLEEQVRNPVVTLDRKLADHPESHLTILKITGQKEGLDKKERAKINRAIKGLKDRRFPPDKECSYNMFITDLNDNPIGKFFYSNRKLDGAEFIEIGDAKYINRARFCFVDSQFNKSCIRTSAYLTKEGTEYLTRYIKKYLRQSFPRQKSNFYFEKTKRISNRRIREKIRECKSYDIFIEGVRVHVNLYGKIEIFSKSPDLDSLLVGDSNLSPYQAKCLSVFSKNTSFKKWIKETNPKANLFIGQTIYTLSKVIESIFADIQ